MQKGFRRWLKLGHIANHSVVTGPLKVAWLGRLVPVKNVPLLVEIMEMTLKRTPDIQFLIAGDGPERDAVEAAAQRFPAQVTWLGWQKDVAPLIAQCDVLMQTSHNEGTPVALIQGMAAGRPFVATPVGGVVDMAQGEGYGAHMSAAGLEMPFLHRRPLWRLWKH